METIWSISLSLFRVSGRRSMETIELWSVLNDAFPLLPDLTKFLYSLFQAYLFVVLQHRKRGRRRSVSVSPIERTQFIPYIVEDVDKSTYSI